MHGCMFKSRVVVELASVKIYFMHVFFYDKHNSLWEEDNNQR